eukprot:gene4207-5981_t
MNLTQLRIFRIINCGTRQTKAIHTFAQPKSNFAIASYVRNFSNDKLRETLRKIGEKAKNRTNTNNQIDNHNNGNESNTQDSINESIPADNKNNSSTNSGKLDESHSANENENEKNYFHSNNKNKSDESNEREESKSSNKPPFDFSSFITKATTVVKSSTTFLVENTQLAYLEMIGAKKDTVLRKKFHQAESFKAPKTDGDADEEEAKDKGPSAIVLVKEPKSAWESMKERLQDSVLFKEIFKRTKKISSAASETDIGKKAQDIGRGVKDKIEDVREFWETSQNPLVYTISGLWDSLTGETEEGMTITEIRKLDPTFVLDEWLQAVNRDVTPIVIKSHLIGRPGLPTLREHLREGVFSKLSADIRTRENDGFAFDVNVLNTEPIAKPILKVVEDGGAVIVVNYFVQLINCVRKNGEIVEGAENETCAKIFSLAFNAQYDEDTSEIQWKVVDYMVSEQSVPYI